MDKRANIASTVGAELRSTKRVSAMPNISLELTAYSVRSCLAPAVGRGSPLRRRGLKRPMPIAIEVHHISNGTPGRRPIAPQRPA
jgi:hypothetical protein